VDQAKAQAIERYFKRYIIIDLTTQRIEAVAGAWVAELRVGAIQRFFSINRTIARAMTPFHVHEANVFGVYRKLGALMLAHPKIRVVADCGAGRTWHFPFHYKKWFNIYLIGLDIDADEMTGNASLDQTIDCDVTTSMPLENGSVDLFMVSSGVEHFSDNQRFLENCFQALRPGGYVIAQFPGRYSPFAIANRFLPRRLAKMLLRTSMKDSDGVLGFEAHYDRTNFSAFRSIAKKAGFEITYYSPGYYSSNYAEFFLPLWVFSYIYDVVRFAIGVKDLASYNLFLLRKPDADAPSADFQLYAWN